MAAIRRSSDEDLDQQTLLDQLRAGSTRSTEPVPVEGAPAGSYTVTDGSPNVLRPPADNGGITGGMDKQISGPIAKLPGSESWDTDGYAAPAYITSSFGSALPGWDAQKWNDPNNQHPKYVVGRILSKYGFDDAGTQQAVQEVMKAYPGTTFNGKDKLTIPGVGTVDFRKGASVGGQGFQWLDPNDTGVTSGSAQGAAKMGVGPDGQPVSSAVNGLMQGSTYSQLMQYLQSVLGPEATDQRALLSQMQQ